ncbi:nuclear transport factor 2 family protein [Mesorhizobium sp. BR1-1-16]|uniref:nuclear transport factor 2 family protein n=1 Tax=Mesorhizobium sp. BR1-1-16 TaxID=2876653 RepID=UPI001CCD944C|nr:nuclear transport factor 2 family protein [Mesorhizobium sp. BR1-1-16]MBZ9937261.1 nuclear transport factor 2 family protein [Mesorhizobium sp. BR1-1-16]
MTITFPQPIADYYAADRDKDSDAVAQCFTEDATIVDERQTFRGREAIRQWNANASARFDYSVDPYALTEAGKTVRVTARVAGNFPGSPVDLRYVFELDGELIQRLEIVP